MPLLSSHNLEKVYASGESSLGKAAAQVRAVGDVSRDIDAASAPKTKFHNMVYYFCTDDPKAEFERNPPAFVKEGA